MGCTGPISLAYAAAVVRKTLGVLPKSAEIMVSGNIVKNVKSVIVPHTGGQCGYIDAGVIPKFSLCSDGVAWFQSNGQFMDGSYVPAAGDIIFFDWSNDGSVDHTGIVESVVDGVVHTIEGNSGDACRRKSYPIGDDRIYGYGVPAY